MNSWTLILIRNCDLILSFRELFPCSSQRVLKCFPYEILSGFLSCKHEGNLNEVRKLGFIETVRGVQGWSPPTSLKLRGSGIADPATQGGERFTVRSRVQQEKEGILNSNWGLSLKTDQKWLFGRRTMVSLRRCTTLGEVVTSIHISEWTLPNFNLIWIWIVAQVRQDDGMDG